MSVSAKSDEHEGALSRSVNEEQQRTGFKNGKKRNHEIMKSQKKQRNFVMIDFLKSNPAKLLLLCTMAQSMSCI